MASLPPMRRTKSSPWPGYFSSNPAVRARAELDQVDPDAAAPINRRRDLNNLRAVQAVMDDLGHDFAPHHLLDEGLLGDAGFGPTGRPKRPYGATDPAGDAFSFDSGLDGYLTGTPGQDRDDPGDMRDSFSVDMAKEDESDSGSTLREAIAKQVDGLRAIARELRAVAHRDGWEGRGSETYDGRIRLGGTIQQSLEDTANQVQVMSDFLVGWIYEEARKDWERKKKKFWGGTSEKPSPDGEDYHPPINDPLLEFQRLLREIRRWGHPATDFKLGRTANGLLAHEAVETMQALRAGGHPAVFDRLGQLERQRRRRLTQQDENQIRFGNPSINWGPEGPRPRRQLEVPTPTRGVVFFELDED